MDEAVKAKLPDANAVKQNEKKWTQTLMKAGWSAIPNIIIEKQRALGLDALDINILLHLIQYWWLEENVPRPAVGTIAEALGVTPRTIQKRIPHKPRQRLYPISIKTRSFPWRGYLL